ncbi:hypothetical protein ASU80_20430 [Enterobacter hormaechei subsp. xiangfangensis]|uniref:hypothetical protein n=1 Tax=Enterobacter hormaechei TaxID=158836 RepID=UPI000735D547|nr:hypothetical protein [Enterobacter hormaechei]KTI13303.1 hypothetical protein ASV11_21195 [Enterobacter hormaechei subsp. xiangfangensis]KTJ63474.1 hypothetical protein ASU80_20430 [Enterobacter hormaechei subsp. xiangfangensis]MDR9967922.1 hypothetical protein [Enterobacter hormaechei subsp. xiangfangensis]
MAQFGAVFPDGISDYLKLYITSEDLCVVGYIGEGASAQLSANWTSAYEGDSVGSVAGETLANITQSLSNNTSITRLNSLVVWQGSQPFEFILPIYLHARYDANIEVNAAIAALCAMQAPELNDITPAGRRPYPCVLDIGRRFKIVDVVIRDVQFELDAPRTAEGFYTHNNVSLQCSAMAVTNRSEMKNLFL